MNASLFTSVLNIELKDSEGKVKLVYWWKNKHRIILMTGTTHQHHFESCVSLISFHFRKHPCYLKIKKKRKEHDLRALIDWISSNKSLSHRNSQSEERKISLTANENSKYDQANFPKRGKTQVTKSPFEPIKERSAAKPMRSLIDFDTQLRQLLSS